MSVFDSVYLALCSLAQRKQILQAQLKGQRFKSPFSCMDRIVYQDGMNREIVYWNAHALCVCEIKVHSKESRQLTMNRFVEDQNQN